MFDRLIGKETSVIIKLHYHDKEGGFASNMEFKPCYYANEFENVNEFIKKDIEKMQSKMNINFAIKLSGKLNGNDINQEFKDLDSYHHFLENNSLISTKHNASKLN